jgi:hypothetical protein
MNDILQKIVTLVAQGDFRISDHAYSELIKDGLLFREIVSTVGKWELIEFYPEFPKGPCCLVLLYDHRDRPVHAVWGIPKGLNSPAVLITAYHPDPGRWENDWRIRRK